MCSPGLAILGAQSFGAVTSTVGAIFGASSQKSGYKYAATMADINARISEGNARNMIHAGIVEESRIKLAGSQAKGAQIARIASSGVDLTSTTAQARLAGTDLITEVDANTMRANALRAAWGQRIEAGNERAKANSARASAASISPVMAGLTSLIAGAGQVASSWYSLNKEGAFAKKPASGASSSAVWPESSPQEYDERMPGGIFGKGRKVPSMLNAGLGY
jgi:hypothetical protein